MMMDTGELIATARGQATLLNALADRLESTTREAADARGERDKARAAMARQPDGRD
jgi:hypothetical protein